MDDLEPLARLLDLKDSGPTNFKVNEGLLNPTLYEAQVFFEYSFVGCYSLQIY